MLIGKQPAIVSAIASETQMHHLDATPRRADRGGRSERLGRVGERFRSPGSPSAHEPIASGDENRTFDEVHLCAAATADH
jgi:hypothetical protein